MATEDAILPQINEDCFATSRLDKEVEFWGPPLAPAAKLEGDDDSRLFTNEKHGVEGNRKNTLVNAGAAFQPHRMLIAGTAVLAAAGLGALGYMWTSAGERIAAQSQQAASVLQSPQIASGPQATSGTPKSSPDPSVAVAWPDLPTSITAETSQVASAASNENVAARQSASQKEDIVFVQRPGVNIRSGPSVNTRVLGSAPKGARLTVTNREGDWVQVESEQFRGWIRSRFLAANEPR